MSSPPPPIHEQVRVWGPESTQRLSLEESLAYCHALATGHYENFSVMSALVPRALRDDFAAVYAFCRWADDLGDEMGSPDESLRLLAWWREELEACFSGVPMHPVMMALADTVTRHDLPREPFEDLIDAFEQDQRVTRYETWDQLIDYCRRSANPVGRLVLMLFGEPREDEFLLPSDAICTGLQLVNHWQDVGRDLLDRDRCYIPREMINVDDFDARLLECAGLGFCSDHAFLEASRGIVASCIRRTEPFFIEGASLIPLLGDEARPVVRLFRDGGLHVMNLIGHWNYETILHRPRLSAVTKFGLISRAWLGARMARRKGGRG
ncbi:MAG TPA: squalene synthase HpnC [Phycisphaerales bacterium]|nr:squalene synthase HpnC [Phycisphaerales bacterium]